MKMQPAFFDRLKKEVHDLTGLDVSSFKDKRVRKELLIKSLPYVLAGWVGNKLSYIYGTSTVKDKAGRLLDMMDRLDCIVSFPPVSLYPGDILTGIAVGAGLRLAVYLKGKDAKKFRKGTEYGSAELGGPRDIEPFIDHNNPDNNLILTQTEQLSLAPRMPSPLHNRNKNVLVIGGSGTGKTRFYCKPNAMQLNCSYVFTDPKGTCLEEIGFLLKKAGYKIKVLNTVDFSRSMRYNPFAYIHKESDIMKVADALIEGTTTGKQQGEQFWQDAEKLLYNALIGYIMTVGEDEEEKNFATLLDMVNAMEIREDDDEFKNAVDFMFEELQESEPDNFAVRQYAKFKQAAGKTARSIMITVGARLSRFDIQAVRDVMLYDELELEKLGLEKTAHFMANILYTQMFNLLCEEADLEFGGRLPVHVHCIMDEFSNLGKIPDFEILISTIRSREISASIILQSLAQLKSIYDKPCILQGFSFCRVHSVRTILKSI